MWSWLCADLDHHKPALIVDTQQRLEEAAPPCSMGRGREGSKGGTGLASGRRCGGGWGDQAGELYPMWHTWVLQPTVHLVVVIWPRVCSPDALCAWVTGWRAWHGSRRHAGQGGAGRPAALRSRAGRTGSILPGEQGTSRRMRLAGSTACERLPMCGAHIRCLWPGQGSMRSCAPATCSRSSLLVWSCTTARF